MKWRRLPDTPYIYSEEPTGFFISRGNHDQLVSYLAADSRDAKAPVIVHVVRGIHQDDEAGLRAGITECMRACEALA